MAFLLRYQELTSEVGDVSLGLGTMTKTTAREEADQDPWDAFMLGTGTRTDSREESDSDPAHVGWAVIPRC